MKIILLKDVTKLGRKFDVKDVSSGHALNMLIPRGDAIAATPQAMKKLEAEKAKSEAEKKVQEDLMAKNIKDLDGLTVEVSGKANDKGHLFAGLHREEIAAALASQAKLQVDPSFIAIDHPIKELGDHTIEVKAAGKSARFKLSIQKA